MPNIKAELFINTKTNRIYKMNPFGYDHREKVYAYVYTLKHDIRG